MLLLFFTPTQHKGEHKNNDALHLKPVHVWFFCSILLSSSRAILSGHATGRQVQTFRHTSQRESLADCHGVQTCVHGEWSHVHAQTHRPASCLHKQSFLWGSGSQAHVCTWNFPAAVEETSVDASGKRHKREKGIKSNMKRKKT